MRSLGLLGHRWLKDIREFPQSEYPKMDGIHWKILLIWMIWGYPHFRKPPFWDLVAHLGRSLLLSCHAKFGAAVCRFLGYLSGQPKTWMGFDGI